MVRFIIYSLAHNSSAAQTFTFQYGQIYYIRNWHDYQVDQKNLHSNMVRFIMQEKQL